MSRLTQDGAAELVSRDQILRRERGQGNICFPCSAGHEQDWQPYPVDPYSCYMCDRTYSWYVRAQSSSHGRLIVIYRQSSSLQLHLQYLVYGVDGIYVKKEECVPCKIQYSYYISIKIVLVYGTPVPASTVPPQPLPAPI